MPAAALLLFVPLLTAAATPAAGPTAAETRGALRRAGAVFADRAAVRGGYVYYYSLDLSRRWGEGEATPTQVWVQPPGTPTVGGAFLDAHAATGDDVFLSAATAAAEALVYGQLKSGGWTNKVDFDPAGDPADYRNGKGRGRNFSSLDDGQTSAAMRFLLRCDRAHRGEHAAIAEAARVGTNALLNAQFAGGGFPQVFDGPSPAGPAGPARMPAGDWRDLPRVKAYWTLPTLNDGLAGQVTDTLLFARDRYAADDPDLSAKCGAALKRLGDFLIAARLPAPQPGWAQQYDERMRPAWARPFEPPAVATAESQDAIAALLTLHAATGDDRFLAPIPAALEWLERSALPDGSLPRFLELGTNRPLFMRRAGRSYEMTLDRSEAPRHYGWTGPSRVDELRTRLERRRRGEPDPSPDPAALGQFAGTRSGGLQPPARGAAASLRARSLRSPTAAGSRRYVRQKSALAAAAGAAVESLDADGRWVSVADGSRLVGQPRFPVGFRYLSSETFARNLSGLAAYLSAVSPERKSFLHQPRRPGSGAATALP